MSYNGSGTFNINTAGQPVVTGTVISSSTFNALTADLGTGLSTAITKDGQTVATARIPFAQGINSSLVTDATSTTTGSIITAGGVGIAKALYVGTTLNVTGASTLAGITGAFNGTVGATTPSTGAFTTLSATSTSTLKNIVSTVTAANNLIVNRTDNGPAIVIQTNSVNKGFIGGSGANLVFSGPNGASGAGEFQLTTTGLEVTGTLTSTLGATIYGLTVGRGGGAVATNTAVGASALAATATGGFNSTFGYQAGQSITTGLSNTAIGYQANKTNIAGDQVTAVGSLCLASNTASNNTAVGFASMNSNVSGASNTALGWYSLYSNLSSNNTAVGHQAGYSNTDGATNVFIGDRAGYSNTKGYGIIAIGVEAAYATTRATIGYTGIIAIGIGALKANNTGGPNIAIGGYDSGNIEPALFKNTSGSYNIALGTGALSNNLTASNNTAVGYQAGYSANGPSSIIAVGYQAGYTGILRGLTIGAEAGRSASGDDNICIGFQAGYYTTATTTGTSNIFLGQYCRGSGATISGEYVLGYNLAGKGANTFYVGGTSGAYNGANVTTWATTSDQRIKKNIVDVSNGLSVITALRPVEFEYKENDKHEVGFIAQEYQQVLPDQIIQHAASEAEKEWVDEDGKVFGIQQNLVPYLVKAIQEQQAIITALTTRITALENK